jgi:putative PIG3 family NAD(P)H quinone oxidoreductase
MNIITCNGFGEPDILQVASQPTPTAGDGEVLIKVAAAGLNRADLMQRRGKYPPPAGASAILGMEVAGTIAALGPNTQQWKVGDRVCALLSGGGYAEFATAPETHCLPVPKDTSLLEAAALPEAVTTVYANIFEDADLQPGETVLVHGGSSGIGTTAIQMIKAYGAKVFVTAGSPEKGDLCRKLGADLAINYKSEDFVLAVKDATNGQGVAIVLDMIGGSTINRNLDALAPLGRHISIATQSGSRAEIDVRLIMQKRLRLTGSTLRGRSIGEKARLIKEIRNKIWPWVASGKIKPVIYQSYPLNNAAEAHKVTAVLKLNIFEDIMRFFRFEGYLVGFCGLRGI